MILTDREIRTFLATKQVVIKPEPVNERFSSTSVDLTLSKEIRLWKRPETEGDPPRIINPAAPDYSYKQLAEEHTKEFIIGRKGYVLEPNRFLLAWTKETVELPVYSRIAARVEGKSSLARLGLAIHVTAPTIHSGFQGQIQLEMFNVSSLRIQLSAGMPICQLIFEMAMGTPEKGYKGQYSKQRA